MDKFLTFLGEAFPPPQQKTGPPSGGQKSPFGNSTGPKKPKPSFGDQGTPKKPGNNGLKKPPFGPKAPPKDDGENPPFGQDEQEEGGPNGSPFGQEQGPMDAEALRVQQEIEQEKMEMEAELQRQKAEKEAAERQKVKNMRAQADADVMGALEDKYNDDTDYVEFYPDMMTFARFDDEQKEKEAKARATSTSTPTTSTTVASGGAGGGSAIGSQISSDQQTGNQGETPKLPDAAKTKQDLKSKKIQSTEVDDTESLPQPSVSDEEGAGDDERLGKHQTEPDDELEDELDGEEPEDKELEDEEPLEGEEPDELDKKLDGDLDDEEPEEDEEEGEIGAEEGDEHQLEKSPQKEKELAQGNSTMMGQGERKIFKIKPADHIQGSEFVGQDDFNNEVEDEELGGDEERLEGEGGKPNPFEKKDKKPPFGAKGKDEESEPEEEGEEDEAAPPVKKFSKFESKK